MIYDRIVFVNCCGTARDSYTFKITNKRGLNMINIKDNIFFNSRLCVAL